MIKAVFTHSTARSPALEREVGSAAQGKPRAARIELGSKSSPGLSAGESRGSLQDGLRDEVGHSVF